MILPQLGRWKALWVGQIMTQVSKTVFAARARSLIQLATAITLLTGLLTGCDRSSNTNHIINLKLYQSWQLQAGDSIGGYSVVAGLGDISILLNGKPVYAPFDGQAQKDERSCLIFSSPDVPAYLFRLCGVTNQRLGACNQGETLGSAAILHVATLRKQPNGTWAIVEPSKPIIDRILTRS